MSGQNSTISNSQFQNLNFTSGNIENTQESSLTNLRELFREFIDSSFGKVDVSIK